MMNNQDIRKESDLMTVHEFALSLRVDDTTVRRWIRDGALTDVIVLPARGIRKSYRIPKSTLSAMLTIR